MVALLDDDSRSRHFPLCAARRRQNIQRILNELDEQLIVMTRTNADWAYWDDTYQFIESRNPAFVTSNLSAAVLQQLHLSVIVLLDTQGALSCKKPKT